MDSMTVSECRPSKRQRTLHSPILGDARISSTGFRLPGPTRALGGRSTSTGVRPSDITGDDISRNIHLLFQSSTLIDWERAYVKCKSTLDSFSAQRLAPTGFRVHGEADRLLQSRRGPSAHTEAEDHIRGLIQMKDISTHPQVSIAEALRSDSDRGINFPKGKHPPNMPIPQRGQKVVNREAALPREQAVQASSPGSLYPLTPPLDEILCDHHQSRGGLSESTKLVDGAAMDDQERGHATRSKPDNPNKTGSGSLEGYSDTLDASVQPNGDELSIRQKSSSSHSAQSAYVTKDIAESADSPNLPESDSSGTVFQHSEDRQSQRAISTDRSSSLARSSASNAKARRCHICQQPHSELMPLIRCSKCRRRYHRGCHNPRIINEASDRWECRLCASPSQTLSNQIKGTSERSSSSMARTASQTRQVVGERRQDENNRILSRLPLSGSASNPRPGSSIWSQYERQPLRPASVGQLTIPFLIDLPSTPKEDTTQADAIVADVEPMEQLEAVVNPPAKINSCSQCKQTLVRSHVDNSERSLCDPCLEELERVRKDDRVLKNNVGSPVLQIPDSPPPLSRIEPSRDLAAAASENLARYVPGSNRQPLQSLPVTVDKHQTLSLALEGNKCQPESQPRTSTNHVGNDLSGIPEELSDAHNARKSSTCASKTRKRRLPWLSEASLPAREKSQEKTGQPATKRIKYMENKQARSNEVEGSASDSAETSNNLQTEHHEVNSTTHDHTHELQLQIAQLKEELAESKSALRNHAARNATLTTQLLQKEDYIKQKDRELQGRQQQLEHIRKNVLLVTGHNLSVPDQQAYIARGTPGQDENPRINVISDNTERREDSVQSDSPNRMDEQTKQVDSDLESSSSTEDILSPDAEDISISRLSMLDAALLAQQPHRKQGHNQTEIPASRREYVSINPLQAYPEFRIYPSSQESEAGPVKSKPRRKATFGQRQAVHDSSRRDDGSNLEPVDSSAAFDQLLGIPKNPVPVMHNRRLAIRDGTLGSDGKMPRARSFLYVGSKPPES